MAPRLYDVEWNGEDDYIPDLGLERIDALVAKLPTNGFDLGHTQANQSSVTATIKFDRADVADPFAAAELLDAMLHAVTVVRTLHANLVAARARLAQPQDSVA
jgi:hypothetical protein